MKLKCPDQGLTHTVLQEEGKKKKNRIYPLLLCSSRHRALAVLQEAALPHPWNQTIYSHTIIINKAVYTLGPWPCIS